MIISSLHTELILSSSRGDIIETITQSPQFEQIHLAGRWIQRHLADFNGDNVNDILFIDTKKTNTSCIIINGDGTVQSGWPITVENAQGALVRDYLSLNTPQIVLCTDSPSTNQSLLLVDNKGRVLQNHSINYPYDQINNLIPLPPQETTPPMVCFWVKIHFYEMNEEEFKSPAKIWLYIPKNNSVREIPLEISMNAVRFIQPDYNSTNNSWNLDILSINGTIYRYSLKGKLISTIKLPNLNHTPEALLFTYPNYMDNRNLIFCINETGELCAWLPTGEFISEWNKKLPSSAYSNWVAIYPLLADIDMNGLKEVILVGIYPTMIYIFDHEGNVLSGWPQTLPFPELIHPISTPIVLDINGDGGNEIVFTVYGGNQVFNYFTSDGQLFPLWEEDPPNTAEQSPDFLVGDVTGDNYCELICSTHSGYETIIKTNWFGHSPWPSPREVFTNIFYDTDADGFQDSEELYFGTNPLINDTDTDLLLDYSEFQLYHTDPLSSDTDLDHLIDGDEILTFNTDPLSSDTDQDGLVDGEEVYIHNTSPIDNDTDDDNLSDGQEVLHYNTNPNLWDTDNDSLSDGLEVLTYGTDPTIIDTDGDGLSDGVEVYQYGTDPTKRDTDHDLLPDGFEVFLQFNPRSSSDMLIVISGLVVVIFVISSAIYLQKNYRRSQQETWTKHLQQAKLGPLNVAKEAEKMNISVKLAHKWLNESLAISHVSGLYNATTDLYLSVATLDLWLETFGRIPLESLAISLGLSLDELEQLLHHLEAVKQGDWIITADHQLQRHMGN